MAATRLSDSQKTELVRGFRAGESTQALADRYGCSANTVIRVAKTALGAVGYEQLKRQRGRGGSDTAQAEPQASLVALVDPASGDNAADSRVDADAVAGEGGGGLDPEALLSGGFTEDSVDADAAVFLSESGVIHPSDLDGEAVMDSHDPIDDQVVLAETTENDGSVEIDGPIQTNGPIQINRPVIDDRSLNRDQLAGLDAAADLDDVVDLVVDDNLAVDDSEYGDDDDDLIDDDDDETPDGAFHGDDDHASFLPIAVIGLGIDDHSTPAALRPLASAELPESVYMLVDKTVELQARPLREISELGHLPPEEHDRQALVVFTNPRQAKRHCGRTQRVIKLPDTRVIERTARYLLAQGISRVVIEGALYSLPGS